MKRRHFLGLAGTAAVFPQVVLGQQRRVPHVAWLSLPLDPAFLRGFQQGLSASGYVDGSSVVIDAFTAPTNGDLPAYAAKAVASGAEVVVTYGTPPTTAMKAVTSSVPIVFLSVADPVASGFVASVTRPGGNLTGTMVLTSDLIGKQLAMLAELVPGLRRFAVPTFSSDPVTPLFVSQVQQGAKALGLEAQLVAFMDGQDYSQQFQAVFSSNVQAAFQPAYTAFNGSRDLLFDIYLKNKLPVLSAGLFAIGSPTAFSGVVGYAADGLGLVREAGASMVASILRGAKPADLPVQLPTVFDVGVNLDMAKKIGLTIPQSILAQATLVIDYDIRAPKPGAK